MSANLDNVYFESPFENIEYDTSDCGMEPRTLLELNIMKISGIIRRKPNWQQKVFDQNIVGKWEKELEGTPIFHAFPITPEIFQYIIDELRWYANNQDPNNGIGVSSVDGVYESLNQISKDLTQQLDQELQKFEQLKDWHPGSNNQVLDLVHPSMYCFVNGISKEIQESNDKIIKDTKEWDHFIQIGRNNVPNINSTKDIKNKKNSDYSFSKKFQWLPCDLMVGPENSVEILSYINNIHPFQDRKLYDVIQQILNHFVPMFEKVLTEYAYPRGPRIHINSDWYGDSEPKYSDYDSEEYDEVHQEWYENRIPTIPITIPPFIEPKQLEGRSIKLNGRRLQVIVKAANIILTPENPEYSGGVWHIEGMKNESIVATGLYYYKTENISDSTLHFRNFIHDPEDYEQCDYSGVEYVYGLRNEEPELNQPFGYIECLEGKCIGFPNIYQHQVAPFKLTDPSKPGIRKILAFFLVDPTQRVKSTATVRPQQVDWQVMALQRVFQQGYQQDRMPQISEHITRKIVLYSNPMTLKEAQAHRAELMKERKYFIDKNTKVVFEREVSLCEH